jgi:hypothetical protein
MNRFDDLLRLISERMANVFQALHQRIIRYCRVRPHRLDQFILPNQSSIVFYEVLQDLKRLRTEFYFVLTPPQTTSGQV